jgi:hypothetical protein
VIARFDARRLKSAGLVHAGSFEDLVDEFAARIDPVAEFWSGGEGQVEAGEVAGVASVEGAAGPPGV